MRGRWGDKAGRSAGWVLAACAAAAAPCAQAAKDPEILHFDRIRSVTADRDRVQRKANAPLRELRFQALGREFAFDLDPNSALTEQLEASQKLSAGLTLYKGALAGAPSSWVRLAVNGAAIEGMFFDGVDLFVIEPASRSRDMLAAPRGADEAGTIIFKLADVRMDSVEASCATATAKSKTGQQQFDDLVRELKSATSFMQGPGATVRLQMSALGDASFLQRFGTETAARDAIAVRLNNVDGIFSAQLGVEIQTPTIFVNGADADPLSDETSADALLDELASLRDRSPQLKSAGLTHLFTGRDLDGETVGIAYLDALCEAKHGVGLTEVRALNAWRDTLIAAHEIGHNFGANHDGDPLGSCPAAPTGVYLMSSSLSGSDRFSQCSLDVMAPRASAASCIAALPEADISIPQDLGETRAVAGRAFEWRLQTTNVGGVTARRVRTEVLVPPALTVQDAYVVGGSCTSGAGVILCQLGDVPGGAARAVNLTLRGDSVATNSISARAASDNDASLTNNTGEGSLLIESEADVSVALQAPATVAAGADFQAVVTLSNASAEDAAAVVMTLELPSGVAFTSAAAPTGSCSPVVGGARCTLASLPGGATTTAALTLSASTAGSFTLRARVAGAYHDPQSANDSVERVVAATTVTAETQTASPSRGGGGGSMSLAWLAALAALSAWGVAVRVRT